MKADDDRHIGSMIPPDQRQFGIVRHDNADGVAATGGIGVMVCELDGPTQI
ncbi:MAG: hypothetical protein QM681_00850 [Novosphingobium sp.]